MMALEHAGCAAEEREGLPAWQPCNPAAKREIRYARVTQAAPRVTGSWSKLLIFLVSPVGIEPTTT
jgi:hypothetical protein